MRRRKGGKGRSRRKAQDVQAIPKLYARAIVRSEP
jgi:hypothetical protein